MGEWIKRCTKRRPRVLTEAKLFIWQPSLSTRWLWWEWLLWGTRLRPCQGHQMGLEAKWKSSILPSTGNRHLPPFACNKKHEKIFHISSKWMGLHRKTLKGSVWEIGGRGISLWGEWARSLCLLINRFCVASSRGTGLLNSWRGKAFKDSAWWK